MTTAMALSISKTAIYLNQYNEKEEEPFWEFLWPKPCSYIEKCNFSVNKLSPLWIRNQHWVIIRERLKLEYIGGNVYLLLAL